MVVSKRRKKLGHYCWNLEGLRGQADRGTTDLNESKRNDLAGLPFLLAIPESTSTVTLYGYSCYKHPLCHPVKCFFSQSGRF